MAVHVRLVLGLKCGQLGFLLRRENLNHLGFDTRMLDLHLDHVLRILGDQGASLGFVENSFRRRREFSIAGFSFSQIAFTWVCWSAVRLR